MKFIIALMLCCSAALATASDPGDPVFVNPRVWNHRTSATVDIWNTTDTDIECSGSVRLSTRSGRTQSEYYWETIYRGSSRTRTYRLWDYRDEITYVSHSIFCRER